MSNSKLRFRRGARRLSSVIAATAVVGTGAVAATGVAQAEEEPLPEVTLEPFDASEFASQAAELPEGLQTAIERDLNISPAEYLANAEATKVASDAAQRLEASGVDIKGVEIDGQDVTYYVGAEVDLEVAGATVEVGEPETPEYDGDYQVLEDLKGGYGYGMAIGNQIYSRCSLGFSGYDGGGNDRFLSAGHCGLADFSTGEEYEDAYHLDLDEPIGGNGEVPDDAAGEKIGPIVAGSNHFGVDVHHDGGLVDVTSDAWTGVPQVSEWGGGQGNPADGAITIYDSIDPVVGADVCSSGATTGWTCGEIESEEETWELQDRQGNVVSTTTGPTFDACVLGGDSGGSVVVGNYALGVNSGGSTLPPESDCGDWDPEAHSALAYAVSSGEYNAFDLFGAEWELNVEVNEPVIDQVTADEEGATISGSVENAGPNHHVDVHVDGVNAYEDIELDGDGEFVIEIDEALEVGTEYQFTAQAFYGRNAEHSFSEVVEDSFTVEEAPEEPEAEELVVDSPSDGQTTSNTRPPFEGTGEPGAEVALSVGDDEFGGATVSDEGDWEIEPDSDLPRGERFDATVTQTAGEDVQEVTITDLGISLPEVSITAPEDGAEVAGDVTFEGTAFAGAELSLILKPAEAGEEGDNTSAQMLSEGSTVEDEDMGVWEGEFDIDEDGNWTFVPDEELTEGEYTVTAQATAEGDPELTDSEDAVTFTVVAGGGDDDGDEDDLPDTGAGNIMLIVLGAGLLAAGGAAVALRARRQATNA
ncbi:LPXTG cell wall anchor domain-containing protein [Phytoactinopolyspora halophila]|uniref:LPXTG cell wall anchor domain-containing protein n=1 Tax=Phytoactinopolyspora halophila TaxID=1981511 RepID=UPI000F50C761|nr:LPXTG cell wall anchor domain-containing protein [Phytoactinopolyspora halophila]